MTALHAVKSSDKSNRPAVPPVSSNLPSFLSHLSDYVSVAKNAFFHSGIATSYPAGASAQDQD